MKQNKLSRSRCISTALVLLSGFLGAFAPASYAAADTVREDDPAPKIELRNEKDQPIQLSAPERSTVMTFIFTRCAAMEFCPRMNSKFQALQSAIQDKGLFDRLRLLSITLDPEFDRPERLKEFGEAIKADPAIWSFATGSKAQIDSLTSAFRVFRQTEDGVLSHTLCTALVRPDGTVEKIWRGNYWKPEDVLERVQ
ncbi:MAG TPA: SCO family protein [Opitutales bacterium]|nr:SCO family protein [Opitutales bacterium]